MIFMMKSLVIKIKKDDIDVVVDRIVLKDNERSRIFEAIETATKMANGKVVINLIGDKKKLL